MQEIRRYTSKDFEQLVELFKKLHGASLYKDLAFDSEKAKSILVSNLTNDYFFGIVATDDDGNIIGVISACLVTFVFSQELMIDPLIFYITKENKDPTLCMKLFNEYEKWAVRRGVKKLRLTTTTGIEDERFDKMCKMFKLTQCGTIYEKDL